SITQNGRAADQFGSDQTILECLDHELFFADQRVDDQTEAMTACTNRHYKVSRLLGSRSACDQLIQAHDAQNLLAQPDHFVAVDLMNLTVIRSCNLNHR